jgi:4-amino-4-deoxy-L-arabinose transferase-like glycosyltransferase
MGLTLIIFVGAGLALRLVWFLVLGAHQITWEGTEYARAAENLQQGAGYIGMRGTTLYVFPPLYSLAIAAIMSVARNGEAVGVAISIVAGSLLVVPLYLAADIVYGSRPALYTGIIAVSLPFAVDVSTLVLDEPLFLTLIACGLLFTLRTIRDRRPLDAVACGVAFGLAYLTRPEAVVVVAAMLVAVAAATTLQPTRRHHVAASAIVIGTAFIITSLPYVVFLSMNAHHLAIEAKSATNVTIAERMRAGMSYAQAASEIDNAGNDIGPELSPTYYFADPHYRFPGLAALVALALTDTGRHVIDVPNALRSRLYGTVLLLVLSVFGLVAGRWNRQRAGYEFVFGAYYLALLASLASVYHFYPRYAVGFIPLLALWGGHGVEELRTTINTWLHRWRPSLFVRIDLAASMLALLMLLSLFSDRTTFKDDVNSSQTLTERRIGEWMRAAGIPKGSRIFSVSDQSVYYADGIYVMPPWSRDPSAVIAYLTQRNPTYIVVDGEQGTDLPYMATWLTSGIPDPRAHLAHVFEGPQGRIAAVYRWAAAP